jgi:hypothetical protein
MRYDRRLKLTCAWLPFSPSIDVRIVRAVDDADTATSRKWAATDRPVCDCVGVDTVRSTRSERREARVDR